MKFSIMSITLALVAGQQVMANNYAHFYTADGVKSKTGHNINDDGCIRYDYEKQGFTYAQSGMAGDIIKTRCFIMSKGSNCDCQDDGITFVADDTKQFNIDPMYHSFKFIEEGCGENNCAS